MELIKLLWDFRGPNAGPIAQHHVAHLKEFAQTENLNHTRCDVEVISELHHIAFMVVEKAKMNELRERLKPHRGQIYAP